MTLYTYDIEVFRYDWLVIFKRATDGKYFIYHNDTAAVKEFMQNSDCLLGGFNSKHYDCHILKAICCGADNALLKDINDWIIAGNQGFDHWFIKNNKYWFNHFDIRDDMQQGLSLKAIEGHLGLNVEETSVPFDIDRPLTQEELDMTIHYCKHDVDTAEHLRIKTFILCDCCNILCCRVDVETESTTVLSLEETWEGVAECHIVDLEE